jgi:Tail fiber protein gp32
MAYTITASNATLTLSVPGVFPTPQTIQGFATDDAFATELVDTGEMILGVDGQASIAYIPFLTPMTIALQASSPSLGVFEAWTGAEVAAQDKYLASAMILIPAIKRTFNLSGGGLLKTTPFAPVKRTLQPTHYQITWESVVPSLIP